MSEPKEEGLYMKLARMEKKLAEQEGREPEGWLWVEGMDRPRHIDFDAIEEPEEEENPHE